MIGKTFLVVLFLAFLHFVGATEETDNAQNDIRELSTLRYASYQKKRKAILDKYSEKNFEDAMSALPDSILQTIASSLSVEKRYPELSQILLTAWTAKGSEGGIKRISPRTLRQFVRYSQLIMFCIGVDAFAPLAEKILLEDYDGSRRYADMEALIQTRNPQAVSFLLDLVKDPTQSSEVRANALWRLEKCMGGIAPIQLHVLDTETGIGAEPFVPDELRKFAKDRNLPELKLDKKIQDEIFDTTTNQLRLANDAQVSVIAVCILARYGEKSAGEISTALLKDRSPWVRAWCAVSLRTIGSEEALKAIEVAKKTEKNAEVLLVLEGKAKPFAPWLGIPKDSILQKSNDTSSSTP